MNDMTRRPFPNLPDYVATVVILIGAGIFIWAITKAIGGMP